jgi:cell division protein FtsB
MSDNRTIHGDDKQRSSRRSRRYSFIVLFILVSGLFVIGTGFHIDQYTRVLATSEEIKELEDRIKELNDRRKRLEMLKSELYDFETIYEDAKADGMVYPASEQIYWLQIEGETRDKR